MRMTRKKEPLSTELKTKLVLMFLLLAFLIFTLIWKSIR